MKTFWDAWGERMGNAARAGLIVGAMLILALTAAVGFWLLRSDDQVLFADMAPQDAAVMTAELERQKIPYQLSEQPDASGHTGVTILVDRANVYKTRMRLMGKDIPLHGAIGFELFNSSDLGMTEFAQKINYQRALQGELTRTILALEEVRDARVLLALPDQGLFKQAASKPKASVNLSLKPGRTLRAEQVSGIQRLVSAAIPGILVQDVTIVDQRGVALTRGSSDGPEADAAASGAGRLDLKKDTEGYLSRKATAVLERVLGEGQATASVDVTLNMDRMQSNTDELVGAPAKPGATATGVVMRERETVRDVGAPLGGNSAGAPLNPLGGSNQREVEYAVGHRVEQVISQPGSIRRLQVAVVVRQRLGAVQQDQLRAMVAAAVGASLERGDAVVVQSAEGFGAAAAGSAAPATGATEMVPDATLENALPAREGHAAFAVPWPAGITPVGAAALVVALLLLLILGVALVRPRREAATGPISLTEADRQALLVQMQRWMQVPTSTSTPALRPGRPEVAPRDVGQAVR